LKLLSDFHFSGQVNEPIFMEKKFKAALLLSLCAAAAFTQNITFQNQEFEIKNVHAAVVQLDGEQVLKVERDLKALSFDVKRLEATVDEPTYVKLKNVDFTDGTIEVKMLSNIQNPSPFESAQGFIGLAFRINGDDSAFESIYLRPKVGRSDNQKFRNHTVQYFAYPDFKFERLRREFPETYETTAPVGLNEWITFRVEMQGERAELFINDAKHSTMVVPKMLDKTTSGSIGLWVDIGTEGYFKDLKIERAGQPRKQLRQVFQPAGVRHEIPYGDNPSAGKYAQAGDAKIYYEVYGQGQPLVILHGGGGFGSTIEMAGFIDSLKSKYQVIAVSTRGHGKSEIGSLPMTYEQKASDILAVIQAVTDEPVIVLGFSDGAYTGYKLASLFPRMVKKLIAIGAGEQIPGLRKVVFDYDASVKMDSLFFKQQLALAPEPQKIRAFFKDMERFYNSMTASKELFGSIHCPVLLVSGELDRNAPLPTVINAYNMIPNCQLSIVPNAGHVVFTENFAAVWASVAPFLKG